MKISVDESGVGVGKTHAAIEDAIKFAELWLFAVERKEAVQELAARVRVAAELSGVSPTIVEITSDIKDNKKLRGESVRTEIESLATKFSNGHVIAICTHSGMMMSDFSEFSEWNFVCDEVPAFLDIEQKCTNLDLPFFEKFFELEQITSETNDWSLFKPTKEGLKLKTSDIMKDDSHKHLSKLHSITVLSHLGKIGKFPVCSLRKLSHMTGQDVQWVWWSLLSINHLAAFKSIRFLASRFMASMTRKLIDSYNGGIEWDNFSKESVRKFKRRKVEIFYFSERNAAISFLESGTGAKHLTKIAEYIEANTNSKHLIWSSNDKFKKHLVDKLDGDRHLTPKQAGTDRLMHNHSAAMIYAAYPSNIILEILNIFELTKEDWLATNEYETILQFVSRVSVRDANSNKDVSIFVYNKDQAQYLKDYFDSQPYCDSSMDFVDLGLEYTAGRTGRPKKKPLTPIEALEAKETKKRKKSATQKTRRRRDRKKEWAEENITPLFRDN